jgi:multiple sugar transport system permease protein
MDDCAQIPPAQTSPSEMGRPPGTVSERAWAIGLAGPALGLLLVLALGPILGVVWLSLHRSLPIFGIHEFVGLRNYLLLAGDDRFWAACATTLYFTAVSVGGELALGLVIALLLDRLTDERPFAGPGDGQTWLRLMLLIPWAIPTVVSARMWEWLYHPEYGLLNYFLLRSGLVHQPVNWLGDPAWAIHGAILMDVWKTTPFAALLLLAGLKAIPRELYQAAKVDGAGRWATFRRVTLPLLLPVVLIVLVFRTMDAFRVFDAVYVLTGGGPGNSTETLSIYAYKTLFQTLQFGYGSAHAVVMFALVLLITAVYLFLLRRHLKEAA